MLCAVQLQNASSTAGPRFLPRGNQLNATLQLRLSDVGLGSAP
jgi:hypothetical protein